MTIFLSFCHAGGPAGLVAGSPRPRHRSPGRVRRPVSTPARLPQRGLAEFSVGEAHQAAAVTAGPAYGSHLRGAGGRRGRAGAAAGAWGCGGVPAAAGAERRKAERSPSPDGRGDGATRWGACAGHARSMRSAPRRPSRAARLRRGEGGGPPKVALDSCPAQRAPKQEQAVPQRRLDPSLQPGLELSRPEDTRTGHLGRSLHGVGDSLPEYREIAKFDTSHGCL